MLALLLFLGLLIRFIFVSQPGFVDDLVFWKWWGISAADHGALWTFLNTDYNYPPTFIYVLKAIGHLYKLLTPYDTATNLWQTNSFVFLFLAKLPAILCDLFVAWGLYNLTKRSTIVAKSVRLPLLAAGLYLFNPVVIFDSAWWGQTESVGLALIMATLLSIFHWEKPLLAGVFLVLGPLIKAQTVIFAPLLLLLIFKKFGFKKTVEALGAGTVTFILANLELLLTKRADIIIRLILGAIDWFPYVSMNAYNFWWVVVKGAGMTTPDRNLFLGLMNYKMVGLILFATAYVLAIAKISKSKFQISNIFTVFAFVAFSFFMLPTQMHERYIVPIFMFLAILVPLSLGRSKLRYYTIGLYTLLTLAAFYNLHNILIQNYPQNGIAFLTRFNQPRLTIATAYINIGLYLVFAGYFLRTLNRKLVAAVLGTIILVFTTKTALAGKKDVVPLTNLSWSFYHQEWGMPQKNRSVAKNFLSCNYYFYENGIGTHANSTLKFDLGRRFGALETDVGVDTEAPLEASVEFKILGDGKVLWESGRMGKSNLPKHARVELNGVTTLELVVTNSGDGITGDHADWLNPKLFKY